MAKKQFIRHLEFYGFPDQNGYSSDINGVDLSDIREKNKEQDEEIADLEGEKADKKDLVSLSGTVENFVTRQSEINQEFADAISGMSNDIEELKSIDTEFAEQLSALTSGLDESMNAIEILGERMDYAEDGISGLSGTIDTIIEDYAKKDDVYTKEEVDELISSGLSEYATQEWVEEQGYITEESGDSKYAKIEDVEELSNVVESASTEIEQIESSINEIKESLNTANDKIDDLEGEFSAFSENVSSAFSDVNDSIDEVNDKVEDITSDIADIVDSVSANTTAIEEVNNVVNALDEDVNVLSGAIDSNTESIEGIKGDVSALTEDLDDLSSEVELKANKSDLQDLHAEMVQGFDDVENKKADKTDLATVSGNVDSVDAKVDAEIARSTSADTAMQSNINQLDTKVHNAVETVGTFDDRIAAVESGLTKEISDREQADLALVGNSGDSRERDTIWGAKNFAKEMKRQAVSDSEIYTDNAVAGFSTQLANFSADVETKFTGYATTGYVNTRVSEEKSVIESDYNTKINSEKTRAEHAEETITEELSDIYSQLISATTEIAHNSTRIGSITEWDGSDPSQYDDSGNGILDVLHKEFHEYERTHWAIKNIEFVDGNLIITYDTTEGEKQEVIPISL